MTILRVEAPRTGEFRRHFAPSFLPTSRPSDPNTPPLRVPNRRRRPYRPSPLGGAAIARRPYRPSPLADAPPFASLVIRISSIQLCSPS